MKISPLTGSFFSLLLVGVISWVGGDVCVAQNHTISTEDNVINQDTSYENLYFQTTETSSEVASLTVTDDATLTVTKNMTMGNSAYSNVSTLTIDNGHVRLSGDNSVESYGKYNMAGHYPNSNTTIHLKEGTFTVDHLLNLGWHGKGTFTQDSGTATIESIRFNSSSRKNEAGNYYYGTNADCFGTINLNGGTLKLGSIESSCDLYLDHYAINLSGGTLQPKNDTLTVSLNGTLRISSTFYTDAGQTLTWSGNLSGSGNLNTTGTGKVVLSGTANAGSFYFDGLYSNGTWQNGTVDITGNTTGGWRVCGTTINIEEGASVTSYSIKITDRGESPTSIVNQNGGVFNHTGNSTLTFDENGFSNNITNGSNFMIGHWNGNGTYHLKAGTLNAAGTWAQVGWDGNGTLQITDGTANLKGVILVNHKEGTRNATLNLEGGRLNLGEYGIKAVKTDGYPSAKSWEAEQVTSQTVTLGGGTLGALTDWNSKVNMTLAADTVTTVDTQNPTDSNAQTITLSGILSGDGGLNKIGDGKLVLSGVNTYTGKTTVEKGILELNGSLAGTLELQNDAILTGSGRLQSLAFAEGAENARILIQVGEDTNGLTVLGDAMLQEGMFDFLFEDIHAVANQPLPILQATSFSGWEGALDALLADAWQGIIHLSQLDGGIYATVDSASVPEPATWLLCLLGFGLLFRKKFVKTAQH